MKKWIPIFALLIPFLSEAQPFSISWYKVAGGGGNSAGTNGTAVFSVSGTVGQPDASPALTGGQFAVTGGYWSLISAVPTPGAPALTITLQGTSVVVSWPNYGNFTLQQNNNLAVPSGWVTSSYAITTNGSIDNITIPSPTGALFFRLAP